MAVVCMYLRIFHYRQNYRVNGIDNNLIHVRVDVDDDDVDVVVVVVVVAIKGIECNNKYVKQQQQ